MVGGGGRPLLPEILGQLVILRDAFDTIKTVSRIYLGGGGRCAAR